MAESESPKTTSRTPRRLSAARRVLFSVTVCFVVFIAFELLLWLFGAQNLIESEDPSRGFSGLVSVFVRDGDNFRTRPQPMEMTFNDQSFSIHKPSNGLRIFCLGGSSAYGFPWGADVAFTAILGDVLEVAYPNHTIEAVNVGGMSYAMHRLTILAEQIVRYEPDVIIVYSGHNEFIEPLFFDELKSRSWQRSHIEFMLAHSRLVSIIHMLLGVRKDVQGPNEQFTLDVRRRQSIIYMEEDKRRLADAFEAGLRRIVHLARQHQSKVILATVPCNLRDWRPEQSVAGKGLNTRDRQQWLEAHRSARRHVQSGDFADAVADWNLAIKVLPTHAETHYQLAQTYEEVEQWDKARQHYRLACDYDASPIRRISAFNDAVRAVGTEPGILLVDVDRSFEHASPHGLVGLNLIEDYVHPTVEGHERIAWDLYHAISRAGWVKPAEAVSLDRFNEILSHREVTVPRNASWFFNQGALFEHQEHFNEAIEKYREAVKLYPGYTGARVNLAKLLKMQGHFDKAIEHYEEALRVDSRNGMTHNDLASVFEAQGKLERAAIHYRQAVQLEPKSAPIRTNLANVILARGDVSRAIEHYLAALDLDSEYAPAHSNMGIALWSQDQLDEAISHFQEALRISPDFHSAHLNLGRAFQTRGQFEQAIQHFEWVTQSSRGQVKALIGLAGVSHSQGKVTEAIAYLHQALEIDPRIADVHVTLGNLLRQEGNPDEAAKHYDLALQIEPDNRHALNNLVLLLQSQNRLEDAIEKYYHALSHMPEVCDIHNDLAIVLAKLGRLDDAIKHFREALCINPDLAVTRQNLERALKARASRVKQGSAATAESRGTVSGDRQSPEK